MDYVLGFDGGGTKTECVLMDSAGKIVARSRTGPSNPVRVGVERAARQIQTAANLALQKAGIGRHQIAALGAGLGGTGQPEMKEQMRSALQQDFPDAVVSVFTDLETSLAAAGEGPVIVLVAGTGSAAIGRDSSGKIWRAGGYGTISSDEGSAYDIGRRAVSQAMKEREETGSDSSLGKAILKQHRFETWAELQEYSNRSPDEVFPRIFPTVAIAADDGDLKAREILSQAANDLSSLVATVADHIGGRDDKLFVAKTGGTVGCSIFFDDQVDAALSKLLPHVQIGRLRMSPAEAAAHAARY